MHSNLKWASDTQEGTRPHTFCRSEESSSKQLLLCTVTVWTGLTITACLLVQVGSACPLVICIKMWPTKRHQFLQLIWS